MVAVGHWLEQTREEHRRADPRQPSEMESLEAVIATLFLLTDPPPEATAPEELRNLLLAKDLEAIDVREKYLLPAKELVRLFLDAD